MLPVKSPASDYESSQTDTGGRVENTGVLERTRRGEGIEMVP